MPLHIGNWSQVITEDELSWEEQGKLLRLMLNAWSRGCQGEQPAWASDLAWGAFVRLCPGLLETRVEHEAGYAKRRLRTAAAREARWPSVTESVTGSVTEGTPTPTPTPTPTIEQEQVLLINAEPLTANAGAKGRRASDNGRRASDNGDRAPAESESEEVHVPLTQRVAVVETWLTAYALEWERTTDGGVFHYAKCAKELRGLEKRHGRQDVLMAWSRYLAATDIRHLSVPRFAETFGAWAKDRDGPVIALHRNDEAERRWLEQRRKESL